jgi:hypothetical protein
MRLPNIPSRPPAILISLTHCVLRRGTEKVRLDPNVQTFAERALLPLRGVNGRNPDVAQGWSTEEAVVRERNSLRFQLLGSSHAGELRLPRGQGPFIRREGAARCHNHLAVLGRLCHRGWRAIPAHAGRECSNMLSSLPLCGVWLRRLPRPIFSNSRFSV